MTIDSAPGDRSKLPLVKTLYEETRSLRATARILNSGEVPTGRDHWTSWRAARVAIFLRSFNVFIPWDSE